ncbi:hypothetical protein HGP28_10715 [Vibrio sp. SM6]|uniref:Uncharacterized protein n=1 Tax=Vibrio agarilyticus TaxID=2726741 RepID=A0A7X8TRC1_9VIBR|nr:hypothetical protein [Vibrio agarilyticus]NLS13364.1 hypothetical protein [Vibrio agarilyticus]
MNLQINAGQTVPVSISGNWLYIKAASADIDIETESGERVTLSRSSVFDVGRGNALGRLLMSSAVDNALVVLSGFGKFTPPLEGQPISIAAGQTVIVESIPAMEIASGQSMAVESLPAVEIASGQSVAVESLPAVEIASGQSLAVESLPAVEIASGQSLAVESLPAVEIASGQTVAVKASGVVTSRAGEVPQSVAQNANRAQVVVKASAANAGAVQINGGFELGAGESVTLSTSAALELTGAAGDRVSVIELEG